MSRNRLSVIVACAASVSAAAGDGNGVVWRNLAYLHELKGDAAGVLRTELNLSRVATDPAAGTFVLRLQDGRTVSLDENGQGNPL